MTEYSSFDRYFIEKLISLENQKIQYFGFALDDILNGYGTSYVEITDKDIITVFLDKHLFEFKQKYGPRITTIEFFDELTERMAKVLDLTDKLIDKKHISLFGYESVIELGHKNDNLEYYSHVIDDIDLVERIKKVYQKKFIIQNSLHILVENDYKYFDQIKFEKEINQHLISRRISWIALLISCFSLLSPLVQGLLLEKKEKTIISIDKNQYEAIIEEVKKYNNLSIKQDTTNLNQIQKKDKVKQKQFE